METNKTRKPHMTMEQFYKQLELLPKAGFKAFILNRKIRLSIPRRRRCYCPVTAVYKNLTGKPLRGVGDAWVAGSKIGLTNTMVNRIVVYADERDPNSIARNKIARALNLELT